MRREDLHQRSGARGRAAVLASAAAVALLLSGCSFNVKEELGLLNNGPDEFTVVKKKPLEMPEGQAALPEPRPGAASRVDPRPSEDAQIALTGRAAPTVTSDAPSKAENALLAAAKVDVADPEIRKTLAEEDDGGDGRLLDGLLGTGGDPNQEYELDAEKEAERLAEEARKSKNPALEPRAKPE